MISSDEEGPWLGESGTEYIYYVYALDVELPRRLGNYIYAKKNDDKLWVPVYMGEGDLRDLCADRSLLECIKTKGTTHLHARLNTMEAERVSELHDLLARYKNAFPPDGCNNNASSAA